MAWTSPLSRYFEQDRPRVEALLTSLNAPVVPVVSAVPDVPDVPSSSARERRDYDMRNAEMQRLFTFGQPVLDNGVIVTDETILSSTPFFGAVRYISEGIAMLDRKVRTLKDGRYFDDKEHSLAYLFKRRPNPNMTWFDLLQAWIVNAILGNGYLLISWDPVSGRPYRLEHIPSRFVLPEFDLNGVLWYRISGEINGRQVTSIVPHTDILHLKGLSLDGHLGRKTSVVHRNVHSSTLSADTYTASVFGKGAFPSIAIKTAESLDTVEVATMESNVMQRIGGSQNAGRPLVLDGGQDVQFLQWSPLDLTLESCKHLSVEQVCQITKVPRDLLALDTSGTYGAAVQRSKDFFVHCLQPWVEKIEEEINTKLFTDTEIVLGTSLFEFDPSLYLSMSQAEQITMMSDAIRSSQMTPNEAREEFGKDPLPGGDVLYGDINFIPLEAVVQIALAKYLSSDGEKAQSENSNFLKQTSDDEEPTQSGS